MTFHRFLKFNIDELFISSREGQSFTAEDYSAWREIKSEIIPHFEKQHWQPPLKKRFSTDVIKQNERVREAVLRYVLY